MRKLAIFTVVGLMLAAACTAADDSGQEGSEGAEDARGAEEEFEEQRETVEERLEAYGEAVESGRFGRPERITGVPAPGWAGEYVMAPRTDDWEPAIAADPNAPYVYVLATRYAGPVPCKGDCPTPMIVMEISEDGGRTWTKGLPVCRCLGVAGQFDPIIEVVPDTGHVYAVWMNNFNVMFSRSTDHGRTWSRHVSTTRPIAWADKPTLATSADGKDVYVSWNGPTGGDPWIAESHNFGNTWSRTKLVVGDRYFFAYDAAVLPNGTVIFSESSLSYSGPDGAARGIVRHHAFISRNGGLTWSNRVIDEVRLGEDCVSAGCYDDFYAGQTAVSADGDGNLVYAYTGADRHEGKQRIYVKTSADDGQTWSARTRLSPRSEMATGPAIEGTGNGDFRLWFMRTTGGNHNRWNVWYRRSTDGGASWSDAVKISDADSGARYKSPRGFLDVYGDYGEIAITSEGKTIGAWGEGFSWIGPGGAWINREL